MFFLRQKKDYPKAVELYEKGIAITKDAEDVDVLEERLADVKQEL